MTLPSPSKEEDAIIKVLRKRWSHVSAERVLSGAGLVNFYEALCTMRAFSHFCAFLGSAAGDLALTFGATGAYTSPAGYCCGSRKRSPRLRSAKDSNERDVSPACLPKFRPVSSSKSRRAPQLGSSAIVRLEAFPVRWQHILRFGCGWHTPVV